ncbi:MAG: sialidase family protein [Adhaeribacter sp.]
MLFPHIFRNPVQPLLLGVLLLVFSCKGSDQSDDGAKPKPEPQPPTSSGLNYIFKERSEGYACFRIPAILKARDGALLAFAEARKANCKDEGDIDLVMKRSTDGGKTWGPMQLIWDDAGNTCGNPAPVVDQRTGKIVMLMTWNLGEDHIGEINEGTSKNTRRVYLTTSDDHGRTWAPAKEITASTKQPGWGWYATGPCHGLQVSQGPHAGRLVIPCDYIEVGPGRKGYSHVVYSDDGGQTWKIGGISPEAGTNESTVAELSDGRLMLNMRNNSPTRKVSTSTDGGQTWGNVRQDYALLEPVCQGSLLSHKVGSAHTLFFSNPSSSTRTNMTVKMSVNDGQSWAKSYKVHAGPSAYSDLVMVEDDKIGVFYEGGATGPYQGIAFEIIPVANFR